MDVILVDENDISIGVMEKMEAHQKALLHRAFSVFIFNKQGDMLLQKRSETKYHSGGMWTNACCSHPQAHEDILLTAKKRLQEEMGFTTSVAKAFDFIYKAAVGNELTEHEYDHVFIGYYDGEVFPDITEVSEYCYSSLQKIKKSLLTHPENYTEWFKIAFPKMEAYLSKNVDAK